jgi:hypothetical protein
MSECPAVVWWVLPIAEGDSFAFRGRKTSHEALFLGSFG